MLFPSQISFNLHLLKIDESHVNFNLLLLEVAIFFFLVKGDAKLAHTPHHDTLAGCALKNSE